MVSRTYSSNPLDDAGAADGGNSVKTIVPHRGGTKESQKQNPAFTSKTTQPHRVYVVSGTKKDLEALLVIVRKKANTERENCGAQKERGQSCASVREGKLSQRHTG